MGDDKTGEKNPLDFLKTFETDILVPRYGLLLCFKETFLQINQINILPTFNPHFKCEFWNTGFKKCWVDEISKKCVKKNKKTKQ